MPETTIEEAVQAFALWRSQRKVKAKTPDHLKAMAIALLAKHSMSDVCLRLGLSGSALRSWGGLKKVCKKTRPENDFVTLNPDELVSKSTHNEIALQLTTSSGVDCRLTGCLEPDFILRLLQTLHRGNL